MPKWGRLPSDCLTQQEFSRASGHPRESNAIGLPGMKRTSVAHLNSASAKAIDVVGEFWNLLIIRAVFMGVTRFEGLQSDLRIARNILTDRLSTLIEADVLEKIVYNQKPERFEYHLTEKGEDLFAMMSMIKNGETNGSWMMDKQSP